MHPIWIPSKHQEYVIDASIVQFTMINFIKETLVNLHLMLIITMVILHYNSFYILLKHNTKC